MTVKRKPLLIDTRFLSPLPKAMWDLACARCDRRNSRWQLSEPDLNEAPQEEKSADPVKSVYPLCSLCFLYQSNWGLKRRQDVDDLVRETEEEKGKVFEKDIGGQLLNCEDANHILAAIALTSRIAGIRGKQ